MKQINETYFPRGGPKKELIHKKSSLVRKDRHKQKKQVMMKKENKTLLSEEPEKLQRNKIEGLSFNTLAEGMLVIGCVRGLYLRYVSLSLPDGIFAQLPATSVSPAYTQGLKELHKGKITEEECPPLSKLFQIGEMLCCRINSIEESGRFYPFITVSISPEHVNYGRSHSSVKVGDLLIAAVESREDYGYVMFTGIQGLTAFLKDVEAVKYIESRNNNRPLARGQVVRCMITKAVGRDSSTVAQLTANPDVVSGSIFKSDITIEKLIPTTRVNVIIKNVQPDGLEVKVLGCPMDILCYITSSHLQSCWSEPEHYIPGTKLTATVLYIVLPTMMVFLSLKTELNGIVEQKLKNGVIIDNAKVAAVTKTGIYVSIRKKEDELKGFISLKHIDGSLGPEELPLKYPVGTELQTRIINFDPIKKTYMCSLERTFINEKYVAVSNVCVGDIVDCTVKDLGAAGAHLSLGRLTVFAPTTHVSNFPVKIIKTKLSIGQQVKARVWSVSEIGNNILVTLKPTLLNSEPLVSYEQARKGDQYYGVITNLCKNGFYVSFYNDVCGFLPKKYLGYAADVTKDFVKGQLAKCYIMDVDCNERKLTLGFTQKGNQPDQNIRTNNAEIVMHNWFKELNKGKVTGDAHNTVDKIIKKGVYKFASHVAACYHTQDYKTGSRLTGKVVSSTGNGIYIEFENNINGILPGHLHGKYTVEQDVEVIVLWQDPTTKLYLQPVGIFLEDHNVKPSNDFIGSHVIGRVLFSKPGMAICVLTGETPLAKLLAYTPCFPNSVLNLESEHTLIVQNVIDNYIICLERETLIKIYNDHNLEVPEHILNAAQMKIKGKCVNEIDLFSVQENKEDSGDNCELKSDKQSKRKSEESFTEKWGEFSLMCKKIKNNSVVSGQEGINILSIESKQKKKQKKKEIVKDDDAGNVNAENVGTIKKKILKKTKKLVANGKVNCARENKNNSGASYNNWTVIEDERQNGMENILSLEESRETKNAKSKTRKMQNKKKLEDSNTNMNVKEPEDEKEITDRNFINSNKDGGLASIETVKKSKKNKKMNENILNVENQESGSTNSKTNKSAKKRTFEINGESLVNGKNVKLKRNKRKSKSVAYDDDDDDDDRQIQYSSDRSNEAKVEETQKYRKKIVSEDLTLSEVGFSWDAKPEDLIGRVGEPAAADDSEEDEEESIQKLKSKSRMTAAEKRVAAKEAELMLRQKESELLEAEVNPQSADQFDRILLSNPENAELWIKYMAYHLQATEIEKARSVARRALQTMSYRSEGERLNVWIALLNLENMYGTQESLKETLDEALRTNDDFLVYSRMLEIYVNSNKSHDLEQLVNVMLRKYRESEECWLHCCTNLMNCGLYDKARNVLQRALSSVQTKSHINLISKFALLENKHGFKEKAVTLLENVLITYPGRVDVWSVYVDMLVKSGSVKEARQVLERAANQKLAARKMKSIYSKWLSFEEKFGDENSVQHVKKAALHYVNTITSKLE